jgi:PAS domain S-box-containing protein
MIDGATRAIPHDRALPMNGSPTQDATFLWTALAEESGTFVMSVTRLGVIEYANQPAQKMYGSDGRNLAGRHIQEILGVEYAQERVDLISQCIASGKPLTVEEFVRGTLMHAVMRPLPATGNQPSRGVLIVAHPVSFAKHVRNGHTMVKARTSDLGRLSTLTTRELEILRLIGLGLSTADIAKQLGRSVKTIEWHRVSLGEKLGVINRVELARIAIAAGLVGLDDQSPAVTTASE